MTGNSKQTEKLRAVFLAALMVLSVFAGFMAFSGVAAAANAGDAVNVTADPIDTTNSATSNITVVQDGTSDTTYGEVAIAIYDDAGNQIVTADSAQGSNNPPSLDRISLDGNETVFEINTTQLANNNDFQLGEGTVYADGDNTNPSATDTSNDVNASVDLQGLVVTSATGESRVAANDTEIDYTIEVENTGSNAVTQDIEVVSSAANGSLSPDLSNNVTVASNSSVTVDNGSTFSETFTINTGEDLPGANDNVNSYQIAGYTLANTGNTPFGAATVNAASPSGNSLITGSGTEGSVTISVVDDTSERQEGVDVELWVEGDYDTDALVIREGTTNQNGEVTFSGLAVGSDDNNDIRYTARAGANTDDLSSTSTTLSLYEPTQTSDSSTVVTDRLRQPERIEVEPESGSAIADDSDTITYTATVFAGLDGVPDSSDDQPYQGAEVTVTSDGESLSFSGTTPDSSSGDERTYTTDSNGEFTFTVSSDVVQTAEFEFDATAGDSDALDETVTGTFILNGEGNLAGTVNNKDTTNAISDASVWVVSEGDYNTNKRTTTVDLSTVNDGDDTLWVRLVDNETNEIIDNDEYDLRQGDTGTDVRKIDELNESDAAVGEGYALIDDDGDDTIQFNHTRLADEEYYAQVSLNATNAAAGTDVTDVGTENFQNVTSVSGADNTVQTLGGNAPVVFGPTANLTLAATEQLSGLTDADYVDSPGFVNSAGYDTEGTTDDGRFVLSNLPTDFQSGQGYVAIATKIGFTTDFADVTISEDGQISFTESQGSNEFFLEPVEINPDSVDIQQIGTREDPESQLVNFPDQTDDTYQEVSRDGSTVDVFSVETAAEGTPVNATTTVSFADTSVSGSFINIADGTFVSVDNSTNTATLYTGSDGQAEIWYQADSSAVTVDTEKTATLDSDSSTTDYSNVTFVGVINSKSAEVSGIVTDSENQPVPSTVYTSELEIGGDDFTVEPATADLSEFTVSRLDASGNVIESATITRSQAEGYGFSVDMNNDPVFPGVTLDSSVSDLTLVTESTSGVQDASSYTLPRVPATDTGSNSASITAVSQASIDRASSLSDLESGTSVTTDTEVNRTSTANVEISGAVGQTFAITSLTASPTNATQGETVTVEATIENQGAVTAAADVTYSVGETIAEATEQDSVTTSPIVAGDSETIEFSLDTSNFDAGDYVHVVETADDTSTTDQTIETESNSWFESYVDDNGVVDDDGINAAVNDYLNDELSDEEINALVNSYLSDNPVEGEN